MMFWLIAAALALAVTLITMRPLIMRDRERSDSPDVGFYAGQMAEIDAEGERGLIDQATRAQLRLEIARRLLAADKRAAVEAPKRISKTAHRLAIVAIIACAPLALLLHTTLGKPWMADQPLIERLAHAEAIRTNRMTQAEYLSRHGLGDSLPVEDTDDHRLVARLRAAVAERPGDREGYRLLAESEASLGRFGAAADARAQEIALLGQAAPADLYASMGELLVVAANGYVSPEAELAFRTALVRDPEQRLARRYLGSMYLQTGRPDLALVILSAVAEEMSDSDPSMVAISRDLRMAAYLSGADITLDPFEEAAMRAAGMDAAERQAFILGMVETLAARLESEGGSVEEWSRLIHARAVLGDAAGSSAALGQSMREHADDPQAIERLQRTAEEVGIDQ